MDQNQQTKLEQYQNIQAMVQKEIQEQFPKLYEQYATKFGVAEVPLHTHNGIDSPRIKQQDVQGLLGAMAGGVVMAQNNTRYYIGLNARSGIGVTPSIIRFNGTAFYSTTSFTISSSTIGAGAVYRINGWVFTVLAGISPGTTLSTEGPGDAFTSLGITSGTLTKVSGSGPSTVNFSNVAVTNLIRCVIVGDAYLGSSYYNQPESFTSVSLAGTPQSLVQSSSYILINDSGSGPVTQALSSNGHIVSITYNGGIVARATIADNGDFNLTTDPPILNGKLVVDVTNLASGWQIIGNWMLA